MALQGLVYLIIGFVIALLLLWIVCWAIETFLAVAIPQQVKVAIAIIVLLLFLLSLLGHVGVFSGVRW